MAWNTPKTDWASDDPLTHADMNAIGENLAVLAPLAPFHDLHLTGKLDVDESIDCYDVAGNLIEISTGNNITFVVKKPITCLLFGANSNATLQLVTSGGNRTFYVGGSANGDPICLNPGTWHLVSSNMTITLRCESAYGSADGSDIWVQI